MSFSTGFRPLTLMLFAAAGSLSAPLAADTEADASAQAIFAGGCFWCMEPPYDRQPGVSATISGYIGGELDNPTYEEITGGDTGHAEAVKVEYDPEQISYEQLLAIFWRNIDPFAEGRQFCDVGNQYRSAIFYDNDEQRELAEASKAEMEDRFERDIATEIVSADTFWPAEEYHQNYYEKNPVRYKFYRFSCGRDGRLEEVWGEEAGGPTF
ncbi:MAG: peptide-methionine (S)-S-oxide reductase MsrA [Pseudomonadota bacterium]